MPHLHIVNNKLKYIVLFEFNLNIFIVLVIRISFDNYPIYFGKYLRKTLKISPFKKLCLLIPVTMQKHRTTPN